jgi:nitroreductase
MDLYEAIYHRRSHRLYKPDMPSRETLKKVINAALWAPSGSNLQPWEIAVMAGKFRDDFVALASGAFQYMLTYLRKRLDEEGIQGAARFFKNLGGAPVVIAVTIEKDPDFPPNFSNIQSGAALMQNLLLAAHAEGLGTCWMAGVRFVEKELVEFLGKPQQQLLAITPIGYPAKTPAVPPRKPREVRWLGFE